MQSTNVIRSPDTYGKMTDMSSGRNFQCGIDSRSTNFRDTSFTGSSISNSKRIEDTVEFIDEKEDTTTSDEPTDALYNFPWDFKNKASQLLLQTSMTEASKQNSKSQTSHASIPPPPPQCPPPSSANSTLQTTSKIEEDEYCAPWDLKLQEEMFKKMSQQKKDATIATSSNTNTNKSSNSPKSESESTNNNLSTVTSDTSVRSNKTVNDSTPKQSIQPQNIEESNEYSPPWELKQSILLQTIQSQNNANPNSSAKTTATSMPAPLCTSSTTSTLTNTTNQQNTSALASLFNQFSRTRLSTRSNTSSSSSTRSSTSSLSASSPPSIPPPPLPPSIPPPPPPSSMSTSIHRCNSLCNHTNQHIQQSPRLSHRHLCQTNSSSNLIPGCSSNNSNNNNSLLMSRSGGAGLVSGSSCNSCSLKNTIIMNTTNSTYLNESTNNKFSSWGTNTSSSNSSNTNSFDTNHIISDESKSSFSKLNRGSNQQQHFVYPSMINHFQTAQLGGQQVSIDTSNTMNNKTIQIGGIPVTALVFQQTCGSLPANFLPLNIQNQMQVISPTSLSHLRLLERQVWFHGKITRKQAENILENRPIGSFLIRQSESGNANDFSLSLVGSGVVHMRISMKNGEYILGQCSQPFNSIVKMVEHYGKVEVPIKGALHVRLTNPVPIS